VLGILDPDEDDPESAFVPDVPDVTPDVPEAPDPTPDIPDPSDAPESLRREFWVQVLLFNLGLLAVSLGLMLVVFDRSFLVGGVVVLVGVAALLFGYQRYRAFTRQE